MAENLKDIRRRIKSVKNTQQITKAMKMVAASKLRRAQSRAEAARPYAENLREVLQRVAARTSVVSHPLMAVRTVRKVAFLVLTSDRGLCGAYNANVLRQATQAVATVGERRYGIIAMGRKGRDFFRRRGYELLGEFAPVGDEARFEQAKAAAERAMALYTAEAVDEVVLVYTRFVSAMQQHAVAIPLLPISGEALRGEQHAVTGGYIFEPGAREILAAMLPKYVESQVFEALQEAKASEHGARMRAMDAATRNCADLIDRLTLRHNRARQAAITKEIIEIVSGAAAQ